MLAIPGFGEKGDDAEEKQEDPYVVIERPKDRSDSLNENFRWRAERAINHRIRKMERMEDKSFFRHEKHIFILTWSGRPVYSLFGEETDLASFMGVITAIVATIQATNDAIRCIVAGGTRFVFLVKGPIYMLCVHKTTESDNQIVNQLNYIHAQIIGVLAGQINSILEQKPGYDMSQLMGGTEYLLHALISDFDINPCYLLNSIHVLRMGASIRYDVGKIIKNERKSNKKWGKNLLYAMILAKNHLVQLIQPKKQLLDTADILLIIHFVTQSQSFRHGVAWTPICLPKFNDKGFLYAAVNYIAKDICLVLVSIDRENFSHISECMERIHKSLRAIGALDVVSDCLSNEFFSIDEIFGTPILGALSPLRCFLFKNPKVSQYIRPAYAPPYITEESRKKLFRRFQHVHGRVVETGADRHHIYFEQTTLDSMLVWIKPGEFELYAALMPLVSKDEAVAACTSALRWISNHEKSLFLSPFRTW